MALLGAHMSTSGGLSTAFDRGAAVGVDTMQIFTKNQNRWQQKPTPPEEIAALGREAGGDGHRAGRVARGVSAQPGHAQRRACGRSRSMRWPTS